eukprot:g7959.t1
MPVPWKISHPDEAGAPVEPPSVNAVLPKMLLGSTHAPKRFDMLAEQFKRLREMLNKLEAEDVLYLRRVVSSEDLPQNLKTLIDLGHMIPREVSKRQRCLRPGRRGLGTAAARRFLRPGLPV